jgi:anti-sigma-K factor RskA
MMTDEQLNDLLRRVTPAGPPSALRARIMAARQSPSAWRWATAAAAVLALTIGLHMSTVRADREIRRLVAPAESDRTSLPGLRAVLGDDDSLMQQSALWTAQERRNAVSREIDTP